MNTDYIIVTLYLIPVFLISISVHEFSHGYMSYKLGDPTAKNMGRLTLNPLKHIDWFGALTFILMRVGWAKPVPVNPIYYKNRKTGIILTSLAGALANITLALLFAFPMAITGASLGLKNSEMFVVGVSLFRGTDIQIILYNLFSLLFAVNIIIAVFNLLPVPPLDGSKILSALLPSKYYYKIFRYEQYIILVFIAVIFIFPQVLHAIMSPFLWFFKFAIECIVTGVLSIF